MSHSSSSHSSSRSSSHSLTLTSCFYIMQSKVNPSKYIEWMGNFISIVHQFNLVIYTDQSTFDYIRHIDITQKPNIVIIVKPLDQLYNYQYKDYWIHNHAKNSLLNQTTCWELNMLWAEKIHFVKETIERKLFDTDLYGWCDIGYFRNRPNDTKIRDLLSWPNPEKIKLLDTRKIVYACVNNDDAYMEKLIQRIRDKNAAGLPSIPIPPSQISIAGGFFLLHKDVIDWWMNTFDTTLRLYFQHGYLVKDDQLILADCVFSNVERFALYREALPSYDNWFMFQRIFA